MKGIEDKGCLDFGAESQEHSGNGSSNSSTSFDFHKGSSKNRSFSRQTGLGKPTPSKWDDAQKWLVNLSRGGGGGEKKQTYSSQSAPRNSNADDRRLIALVPKTEEEWDGEEEVSSGLEVVQFEMESKKVDCDESMWRINKPSKGPSVSGVRSVNVRDMGTEMTPSVSQEVSRAATPLKATTPVTRSPLSSGCSTPIRYQNGTIAIENGQISSVLSAENRVEVVNSVTTDNQQNQINSYQTSSMKQSPMEIRATAWDEAECAKYMARYKREEVKIQAWENHEKRKAEMEMRRMEVKAERLKSRAQEKFTNKVAATRRKAEEKRANAEAKLNEKAVETSERADYIRRTGHLPSSFSFKLPSFCR